ncbi:MULTISPECIES: phosphoribosylaminoimidazolesuccinocarboxamide synthase [unclassified Chitinophaga]|uniref:phosphoribosylaminoimidazolesuccinocarboxamide synthase n=1 Tax=unclassified Chitinophaga TaxID=2619133 RepID=UPI0009D35BD5|nr:MULTISPECIES: phosphoribosylaminoimidazolesuccinocarboxamide synthase [unclassified Chitinophaga]OMP79900.1 phosphoribosylaminoimidazolesuccinocarboxamide synthase [[Flexibacter] sp. ATCC 35208]WPV64158.1 phosphoribosylaminoimidazolesuccinocarboxamide synthase [Chitinophaga sp. LS1]
MLEPKFKFPKQTAFYKGKVRDVYTIDDKEMVMIASDRISAFDVVLPRPIPYKGQVLNQVAAIMLEATKDIVPNWVKAVPLPNVTIGLKCETFPVEMVVRGNLTGHAWRTYKSGKRELCGVTMPEGLKENDYFPTPIITPTTKAHEGHDEDISREDIIAKGLVSKEDYERLEQYTLGLFARGKELAAKRGLILVDTKYEFGKIGDTIYVIDEIHTPDSSRYFYADGYEEKQKAGEPQKQLSKEFVREWLMANGFQGKEGQQVPEMTDEFVNTVSERYIELFENITGQKFVKENVSEADSEKKIIETLNSL